MKAKGAIIGLGAGIVAGILLSPKKGSESYEELKRKLNNIYLQAKELNIDDLKNNVEDLRIELSKLDSTKSKEIVNDQAEKIKSNLNNLVDKLQKNENIKPTLDNAVTSLENGAIEVINFFDNNDLAKQAKTKKDEFMNKANEFAKEAKEKSSDFYDKTSASLSKASEIAAAKRDEILGNVDSTVDYLEKNVNDRVNELKDETEKITRDASQDDIKKIIDEANSTDNNENIDEKVRERVSKVNKEVNK
ncbi:YtxH domain-containing protein [Mycoplasma sp. P36-A1]|uniref:YtxH domain-containing protein n=1 Tax=Mycoplasma sp. P36-A1 TaxID=3252900 RepID=UPI003C2ACB8C